MAKGMTSSESEISNEKSNESQMDLINRQDVLDAINASYGFASAINNIKALPSAQPDLSGYSDRLWKAAYERGKVEAQRTGKWINCDGSEHWKCDKCGYRAGYWFNEENSSSWELDMSEWLSDFCPNCGAKME